MACLTVHTIWSQGLIMVAQGSFSREEERKLEREMGEEGMKRGRKVG